jgi:4-amino-4-deoxy-L-arabinose transferase-like glycosyltransferase
MAGAETAAPRRYTLRVAGWVALAVALTAVLLLAALLLFVSDGAGHSYLEAVTRQQATRDALAPALWAAGLALVAVSATVAWLAALHASFRYAGPLYRLERNLERALAEGPAAAGPIRHGDQLQAEYRRFAEALDALRAHHDALAQAVDQAGAADADGWPEALARLERTETRARL